jgi:hypothetical protein
MWWGKGLKPRGHLTVAVEVVDEREELVRDQRTKKQLKEQHKRDVKHFLRDINIESQHNADGEVQREREKDNADAKKSENKLLDEKRADKTDSGCASPKSRPRRKCCDSSCASD